MDPYEIRTVDKTQSQAVIDVLTLAFGSDPLARYVFPKPSDYLYWQPRLAGAMCDQGLDHGGVKMTAENDAAAIWLPPGVEPDREAFAQMNIPPLSSDAAASQHFRARIRGYHPDTPHWYLWMIGVDPRLRGKGLGSALLHHTLRLCDATGQIAYLESSDPRNVPLYERHGFEVMGVVSVADIPPITPMIRPTRG